MNENERENERNVRLYKWYMTLRKPVLWGPILISGIIHLGQMNLPEIYFMEAIVLVGTIILQVPTGALADLIGRKKTVIIGSILYAISAMWFALMRTPFDVWGANIAWMLGASLCSGADSAFLYDSLKSVGKESEYKKIDGEATGNQLLIVAFCALATGYLAEYSLRLPLLLSIPGVLFSAAIPFFFKEPRTEKKFSATEQMGMMHTGISFVMRHNKVLWIIGFTTLINVAGKIWFFTYNPYFELVNLDLKYYGVVFFLLGVIAWFFSKYAHRISEKIAERNIVVLIVALVGFPILVMGSCISVVSVCMIFPQNIVRGFMRPFFGDLLNRQLGSENRATVISVQSAVSGLAQFVALGGFGYALAALGLPLCLQVLGVITMALGITAILGHRKIFG